MAEQKVETNDFANIDAHLDYQAVVIGAGVAGICHLVN